MKIKFNFTHVVGYVVCFFPTPLNLLKTQMFYIHRGVTTPPHPVVVVVTSRCGVCVVSGVGGSGVGGGWVRVGGEGKGKYLTYSIVDNLFGWLRR